MRTQDELVKRFNERVADDIMGFEVAEYFFRMDWEHVKQFLKEEATEKYWSAQEGLERDDILGRMKEYMPFAKNKAENGRGISAHRSVGHYIAWIWLMEDDDLLAEVEKAYAEYQEDYCIGILEMICEHYFSE